MKQLLYTLPIILGLLSCQSRQQVTKSISTLDSTLQVKATSILENKLSEINAQFGKIVQTTNLVRTLL